jgi:hypothetical protein
VITLAIGFALSASVAEAKPRTKRHKTSSVEKSSSKNKKKKNRKKKKTTSKRDDKPSNSAVNKRIERPDDYESAPAFRYGNLSREDCEAELARRKVPFEPETETWLGVRAPVRITGPLHGVTYRTRLSAEQRATTKWEVADCRLVLALDDFAQILVKHEIAEVIHYSMYRPPEKSHPADKDGIRHGGALALDAGKFVGTDGSILDVDKHWNGRLGAKTCGDDAGPSPATAESKKLRAILCDAVAARIFNSYLTPNYNRGHHNHFHLEVTAGWRSFLIY